ncbi:hypothetical protein Tco_0161855 [Tanacetum coccineum]
MFLGLQVKITWATRFLKFSCKEANRFSLVYRKSFLLSQGSWSFSFELQSLVGVVLDSWFSSRNRFVGFLLNFLLEQGIDRKGSSIDEGWVKFRVGQHQSGKIKVIKGSLVILSGTRRANCVYTLDGQAVTKNTLKGRKQLGEYQTGWKIKTGNVLDSCNQSMSKVFWADDTTMSTYLVNRSPSSAIGFMTPIDMLGVFGWLASIKQGILEPVKVKCIFLGHHKGTVGTKLCRFDDVTSMVVLYRNMGFNESREYKKTFIGSSVSTGSMQVFQGVEYEVELQDNHTFEVEPHGNVDHVVGSQEVQTQDLIYYHPARDREQHSTYELFSYREDSNEAAFAVAAVEKIYAHESLTFNNTVACEVISKWKAGLKDDMDARSDVYVLSNDYKKCSDDNDGYYWEYTPAKGNVLGMEIVKDQSGNTLRVSQSRFYNGKLVQTLLEGHCILSLEGSLSGDCDVEKNGKWSCIYAVGSQEYQMVCTRLDIASADVGMLDKFDRGLQTDVQVFVDFDYAMAGYMTLTEAAKEAIWLKGLAIESGFELKIVVGIATSALSKAIPGSRFQH